MTQQEFAIQALNCAVPTVGLYESSKPPTGEALARLAEIAGRESERAKTDPEKQQRLRALADTFRYLRANEMKNVLGFDVLMVPKSEDKEARGLAFSRLEGYYELLSQQLLQIVWADLRSSSKARKSRAEAAIAALDEAVKVNQPMIYKTIHAITAAAAHGVPQLDITGRPRRKRRQK